MYTFNYFRFGHKMSRNKELNNLLHDYDLEFSKVINGKKFEISFLYNGSQVSGNIYSVIFGISITDDDQNPNYIDEVRRANSSDYEVEYQQFLDEYVDWIKSDGSNIELANLLLNYLNSNKPEFYSVQGSS